MSDLRDLYEEVILDHNRHPRNYPKNPAGANRHAHGFNPLCGDEVQVHLRVEDDVVRDVGFEGHGCAICMASASLMTQAIMDRPVAEADSLVEVVRDVLTEGAGGTQSARLGKLAVLEGVKEYPMRVKCATLAWHTLRAALHEPGGTVTTE
ncbi:MAG: SUF system NifU family Fe-S cluster assembly protein [Gammaproteobacteria bacterium]|nr:SUF system NifU family Fe-S cluster assembly protein [Gammaproteobacteria bacterium]